MESSPQSGRSSPRSAVLLALCACAPFAALEEKRGIRVSGPLAISFAGDVIESRSAPDGERVVFWGDLETDGVVEIFSAALPASGGAGRVTAQPSPQRWSSSTCRSPADRSTG